MLTLTDALARVKRNCAPDVAPVLSDTDILLILTDDLDLSPWTPATAHAWGDVVVPTVPLGRTYLCVLAGTSDATTEPQWLIAPGYTGPVNPLAGSWWGTGVVPFIENVTQTPWFWGLADGTAAWRDYGPFVGEIYDVRAATYAAWRLKAQRASNDPKRKRVGPLLKDFMTYEQCMAMARQYAPFGFM